MGRHARTILANALAGFMAGRIGSKVFDMAVSWCAWGGGSDDADVAAVACELYSLYDDFRDEPADLSGDSREILRRVQAFLGTDLDYAHTWEGLDERWEAIRAYWPFASLTEWRTYEPASATQRPEYDQTLAPPGSKSILRVAAEMGVILLTALAVLGGAAWVVLSVFRP